MPKKAKELSAIQVKRLTRRGAHAVGGVAGLMLQVSKTGARSWVLRAMVGIKRRDIGLGGYPDVTLSLARDKARFLREKINDGIDPIEEKRAARERLILAQAKSITFDEAVTKVLAIREVEYKNAKHLAQWKSTLETYASPIIGKIPVADINREHILQILEPIWKDKTVTASRVRGRIENVLSWAAASDHRSGENPARWKGHLDQLLSKPSKTAKVTHHKALPWQDIAGFMADLKQRQGTAAKALQFLILTAARSGEVRGATWEEIDLKAKLWTVPGERMKTGREHQIPLSKEAITLLKALPKMKDDNHVFPAPRGGALSDMTISAVTKRMKVEAVPHGFRSTFRDWCAENTSFPHNVAEMALAHTIGNKVEAAYRRGDLLAKRTKLMQVWSDYCYTDQEKGAVIQLNRKAAK